MNTEPTRKVGRPKGPEKVLFRKRVSPSDVPRILSLLRDAKVPDVVANEIVGRIDCAVKDGVMPIERDLGGDSMANIRIQVKAMLDDIERLTKELEEEKAKVKRALDLDLDEKGKRGWKLYFELKERSGKSEFDQTQQ